MLFRSVTTRSVSPLAERFSPDSWLAAELILKANYTILLFGTRCGEIHAMRLPEARNLSRSTAGTALTRLALNALEPCESLVEEPQTISARMGRKPVPITPLQDAEVLGVKWFSDRCDDGLDAL